MHSTSHEPDSSRSARRSPLARIGLLGVIGLHAVVASSRAGAQDLDDLRRRLAEVEQEIAELRTSADVEGADPYARAPKFNLRGFGHVTFEARDSDGSGGAGGSTSNTFALGGLDLFLTSALSSRVSFLAETVFETNEAGETVSDVERVILKYTLNDYLNIQAGRFHTTVGWWNETFHHGEWLQTSAGRPQVLSFEDDGGVLPVHLVGLVFKGRADTESFGLDYTLELGNGRGPTPDPPQVVTDANESKAVNLSFGVTPAAMDGLRVGGGVYIDEIPTNTDPTDAPVHGTLDEHIYNLYGVYRARHWDLAAELFLIEHGIDATNTTARSEGWYAQAGFRLDRLTPYVRYDSLSIDDSDPYYATTDDVSTIAVGARWDVNAWNAIKLQIARETTDLAGGGDERAWAVLLQTSFAF